MASPLLDAIAANGKAFLASQDEDARKGLVAAASALIAQLENPAEIMARVGWGEPSRTAALRTAFELGLLKKLSDKPASSEDLAAGTKADPALVGEYPAFNSTNQSNRISESPQTPRRLRTCQGSRQGKLLRNPLHAGNQ